ncbi:hypothetical protein PUN28_008411 [Cardiocondyla obscurior]|uniref:Uncharacterized protein n=1 Tax=Cardiocondyla obscurior TaxID=286306 RepID=A0AAW2G100_9HYME
MRSTYIFHVHFFVKLIYLKISNPLLPLIRILPRRITLLCAISLRSNVISFIDLFSAKSSKRSSRLSLTRCSLIRTESTLRLEILKLLLSHCQLFPNQVELHLETQSDHIFLFHLQTINFY